MPQDQKQRDDFRVEPLRKAHDRVAFSCGIEALDNYLKKQASQDVAKRVAVCFVLTPDGKTAPAAGKAGEARWRPAGQHAVQNTGDNAFDGILVEMKGGAAK